MFGNALLEMASRVADVFCITQMAFILVHNALLAGHGWLFLTYLDFVTTFGALVNKLHVYADFTAEVF